MQKDQVINPALRPYLPLVAGLANILGKDSEVLLHDVSIPEASIVACANAHVTGREVGAPMTAFGRYLMQTEDISGNDGIYNYHAMTGDGRRLRCSVIYLRDKKGKLFGFFCVNTDISKIENARVLLDELLNMTQEPLGQSGVTHTKNEFEVTSVQMPPIQPEKFYRNLDEVWADLLQELKSSINAPIERLTSAELQSLIAKLDSEGFFLIKGSINFLAKELNKSRYTIYGHLRKLRSTTQSDVTS